MLKQTSLTALYLFAGMASYGQDAMTILKKSYEACQSVQNGYYEMTKYNLYMGDKDTIESHFNCHFRKLDGDTLFPCAFHNVRTWKGGQGGAVVYTGEDLITFNTKDSTATITSKTLWADHLKSIAHNYRLYSPLTSSKSAPLPQGAEFTDGTYSFLYHGEEVQNGIPCYHVQVNEVSSYDSSLEMAFLRVEYHYWINKKDYIPFRYSAALDMVMNHDTMYQFDLSVLDSYGIDHLKSDSLLTPDAIPAHYTAKDYVPYKHQEPLTADTLAPLWDLPSLTGEKVSLKGLEGQVVLIDFFYKSCLPCMQALPALQALHEKYKDRGLRVIGIDPYDTVEDDIGKFLAKKGVTYTVLLEGRDAAKDYRVSGYPTLFLIDKTGKIIFVQVGYGPGVEEELDAIIQKYL